jgi:hypothetical protein
MSAARQTEARARAFFVEAEAAAGGIADIHRRVSKIRRPMTGIRKQTPILGKVDL